MTGRKAYRNSRPLKCFRLLVQFVCKTIKSDPVGLRLKLRQPSSSASQGSFLLRQLVGTLLRHGRYLPR
jgi:hypothetical protein